MYDDCNGIVWQWELDTERSLHSLTICSVLQLLPRPQWHALAQLERKEAILGLIIDREYMFSHGGSESHSLTSKHMHASLRGARESLFRSLLLFISVQMPSKTLIVNICL